MDRKEVSAILLKARETIESCDKTISEVKEVHRKSADELRRISEVLNFGQFKFDVDPIPSSSEQLKGITQGVSKVSIGQEEPEVPQLETKQSKKSRKQKNSTLAAMLKKNFTANYDLSSLTYSYERSSKDEEFKREDAKIKPAPVLLFDRNAQTAPKTAKERRQLFAKSSMSRLQKTR